MKTIKIYMVLTLLITLVMISFQANAQVSMTVNSLADDEYSYPWDDPNTPVDESSDGICMDELGRCTIRAAIDESYNMSVPLHLTFSVSGTINLTDILYPTDMSTLRGEGKIELTGTNCLEVDHNTYISGLKFNNSLEAIKVVGSKNLIGGIVGGNVFTNCYIALNIDGDTNFVNRNYFGLDSNKVLGPNTIGIMVTGSENNIGFGGGNTICGSSLAGISIFEGDGNKIRDNYIGTTAEGDVGFGNDMGIFIGGSGWNKIGGDDFSSNNVIAGNTTAGISISGAPPDNYSHSNSIEHNIIGLDPSQSYAIPNGTGIVINNGTEAALIDGNIISGNSQDGIQIFGYNDESRTWGHFITDNRIGINQSGTKFPNGGNGINIYGNVVAGDGLMSVIIGRAPTGANTPNQIIGNLGKGISILSQFGYSPSKIVARKNLIYQNSVSNLFISSLSNNGILPPYGLSFNNNTLAGIHELSNVIIDIYRANINEVQPSAYEWLGSTTTATNGTFSYEITDPTVESVSLTATTYSGNTSEFATLNLITDIKEDDEIIPTEFSLDQNYPNPFNPGTKIKFTIPKNERSETQNVSLIVYDVLGNKVATLVNEEKPVGTYEVEFNGTELSSGIYYYRLQSNDFNEIKKMILLK